MTTLRTAALRALEAMDDLHRTGDTQVFDLCHRETTENLRAALAEPGSDYERGFVDGMLEQARRSVDKAVNAMAEPIIKPEIKDDKPVPPPEAQTEAEKIAYCAGWWAALEKARKAEPVMKPVGVVTSMVKGGVTWHIWPDQMPDGTTLYAAAPIIKPEIKEDKPFGYFRAEPFGWTDCAPTDEGAIPLYERPQAQQFLYNAWADEQIQKEKK